jgi:N utilization substance protein B
MFSVGTGSNMQSKKDNKRFNYKARYFARRFCLQALYQREVADTPIDALEAEFLVKDDISRADVPYFREILRGVVQRQTEIDQQMEPYLERPINSLNYIEKSVLRLAIYELTQRFDIPYRVAINEALELTKQFGTVEGYKFVNGVLDKVAKQIRKDEIQ